MVSDAAPVGLRLSEADLDAIHVVDAVPPRALLHGILFVSSETDDEPPTSDDRYDGDEERDGD